MLRLYLLLVLCAGIGWAVDPPVTGSEGWLISWGSKVSSTVINVTYYYSHKLGWPGGSSYTKQLPRTVSWIRVHVTKCGNWEVYVHGTRGPELGYRRYEMLRDLIVIPCRPSQHQAETTVAATTPAEMTTESHEQEYGSGFLDKDTIPYELFLPRNDPTTRPRPVPSTRTPVETDHPPTAEPVTTDAATARPVHHTEDPTERWNGWDGSGYEETDKDTIPYEHFLPGGGGGRNDATTRPRPVPSTRAPVGTDHPPTSPAPKPSAPSPNVSSLLVARLESQLKELRSKQKSFELHIGDLRKTVADLKRCNPEKLGYKYGAGRFFKLDSRRRGTLARLDFRKSRGDTVLRLAFAATFRVTGAQETALRIFFQIDGVDCFSPSKVEYGLYQKDRQSAVGRPVVVRGVCRSSNRGPILGGHHVITVNIGTVPGYPDRGSDVEIGWASAKFVEVQEVCVNHSDYMAEF